MSMIRWLGRSRSCRRMAVVHSRLYAFDHDHDGNVFGALCDTQELLLHIVSLPTWVAIILLLMRMRCISCHPTCIIVPSSMPNINALRSWQVLLSTIYLSCSVGEQAVLRASQRAFSVPITTKTICSFSSQILHLHPSNPPTLLHQYLYQLMNSRHCISVKLVITLHGYT